MRATAAFRRVTFVLVAAAAVFGCAGSNDGSSFLAEARKAGPPKSGLARIFIYPANRPDNVPIVLDDQLIGDLTAGTYLSRDISAGAHQLSCATSTYPGVTRHNFTAASGQTYYFMVEPSEGAKAKAKATAIGGIFGSIPAVVASAAIGARVAGEGGPVNFVAVPEATAAPTLAGLTLVAN